MPSFLTKVFGRKKQDDDNAKDGSAHASKASSPALLDGKYEAISPTISPSATNFVEGPNTTTSAKDSGTPVPGSANLSSSNATTTAPASSNTLPKEPFKDTPFALFRPKSRVLASQKRSDKNAIPTLSLNLPGPKTLASGNANVDSFNVVFEADPESQVILDDATIGARRLTPLEALILVRACAQAITERGLETLGIMHPHWHSSSPDFQRKLISLFIHSLAPKSRITTLSPTPTSATSAFESELGYTRSPHDVAAVLRWGIRHLRLEDGSFGGAKNQENNIINNTNSELGWYTTYHDAEHNAEYPSRGFSELLLPLLPPAHTELLTATLDVIAALAAHAEANSISGSKLSKFLGLWLLTTTRSEEADDWTRFYARWEHAGRILEHLFLAKIREDSITHRLPTRLQELVQHYPYRIKGSADTDVLLPRPRFSTRQHDALFVRVETLLAEFAEQPKQHPVRLVLEAFKLAPESEFESETHGTGEGQLEDSSKRTDGYMEMWAVVRAAATNSPSESPVSPVAGSTGASVDGPQLSRIFVDETIQLLSSIPADSVEATSPSTGLVSPIVRITSATPSFDRKAIMGNGNGNGSAKTPASTTASPKTSPTTATSPITTDWAQFSTSGFGDAIAPVQPLASTLLDKDVEVTEPLLSRKSSRSQKRRGGSSRNADTTAAGSSKGKGKGKEKRKSAGSDSGLGASGVLTSREAQIIATKIASVHIVQIDEAFIDFWADAIVDPISAAWPTFVICGLKPLAGIASPTAGASGNGAAKPIQWLVIEQTYSREQPAAARTSSPDGQKGHGSRARTSSPRPSFRSDMSSTFAATRKRFSFFGRNSVEKMDKVKGEKEILKETVGTATATGKSKGVTKKKVPAVGDFGEILTEEDDKKHAAVAASSAKDLGIVAATVGIAAAVAGEVVANGDHQAETAPESVPATTSAPAEPVATEEPKEDAAEPVAEVSQTTETEVEPAAAPAVDVVAEPESAEIAAIPAESEPVEEAVLVKDAEDISPPFDQQPAAVPESEPATTAVDEPQERRSPYPRSPSNLLPKLLLFQRKSASQSQNQQ
ncbi:hypothetical protein BJ138DRAFT_842915 [Hygrophoropsis aurantiaca]|uniref:Uncharacterized protein n=1 Tax=Hygrophoropsis aurantiaca TaxID=72124 RepID=A0ACB8AFZ0_9AGAM|nr:hypothetical protein BJ138DRAFT_842915 [Hygrophoropsis aurantiaca]